MASLIARPASVGAMPHIGFDDPGMPNAMLVQEKKPVARCSPLLPA
jgi:hypothetical protein